jgi:hypothetical protein
VFIALSAPENRRQSEFVGVPHHSAIVAVKSVKGHSIRRLTWGNRGRSQKTMDRERDISVMVPSDVGNWQEFIKDRC